jgi:hypothetical protein
MAILAEEEDSVGVPGLELAGRIPTASLPVPIMELDRVDNNTRAPMIRDSNNSKEDPLEEGSAMATSMLAIKTTQSLRRSKIPITTAQMGPNGRRHEKRQSARRSCVRRWKNLNASVRQKPKKKRGSASGKQWRKN